MQLPKNIRQIATPDERIRIYMEDYVSTYLHRLAKLDSPAQKICVLLGSETREEEKQYHFISGAFLLEDSWFDVETGEFTNETWSHIYHNVRTFFPTLEILGWAILRNEFAGREMLLQKEQKLLLRMDTALEEEEQFFCGRKGQEIPVGGYFIYYEKNESMQVFMQGAGNPRVQPELEEENEAEMVKPDAAVHFRTLLNSRREEASQKKVMTYLYLTSSFLVMIVFVIGITMINNYDKMRSMEKSLLYISETLNDQTGDEVQPVMTDVSDISDVIDDSAEESQEEQTTGGDEPVPTALTTPKPVPENVTEDVVQNQTEYTVEAGDTLASICRNHYGSCEMLDTVCEVNGIADRDKILYGQKILLP